MMHKRILPALSVLICLSSCYKRDESHLNEKCTNGCAIFCITVKTGNNSVTPVPDAVVGLVWVDKPQILGEASIDVAKGYTGSDGSVTFNIKPIGNEFSQGSFQVNVSGTADYFPAHKSFYNIRRSDTVLNTSVHMPSIAYLRVVYKNFNPKTTDDAFNAGPFYKTPDYWEGLSLTSPDMANYPNSFFGGYQKPFDSLTYVGLTAGNQYTYFKVLIKRNGIRTDHLDSLYVPKGTMGTYILDYQHSFQ
jgi:hypothetical protein